MCWNRRNDFIFCCFWRRHFLRLNFILKNGGNFCRGHWLDQIINGFNHIGIRRTSTMSLHSLVLVWISRTLFKANVQPLGDAVSQILKIETLQWNLSSANGDESQHVLIVWWNCLIYFSVILVYRRIGKKIKPHPTTSCNLTFVNCTTLNWFLFLTIDVLCFSINVNSLMLKI